MGWPANYYVAGSGSGGGGGGSAHQQRHHQVNPVVYGYQPAVKFFSFLTFFSLLFLMKMFTSSLDTSSALSDMEEVRDEKRKIASTLWDKI